MAKKDSKGRSKGGPPFVQLHHYLLDCPAWLALPTNDRAIYLELARIYDGRNNGYLGFGVRRGSERARINKDSVSRCLARLVEHGFIELASPGGFSRKTPHAAEWRLTVFKCDRTGQVPTKAFMKWRSPNLECGPKLRDSLSETEGQLTSQRAGTVPSFRTAEAV